MKLLHHSYSTNGNRSSGALVRIKANRFLSASLKPAAALLWADNVCSGLKSCAD